MGMIGSRGGAVLKLEEKGAYTNPVGIVEDASSLLIAVASTVSGKTFQVFVCLDPAKDEWYGHQAPGAKTSDPTSIHAGNALVLSNAPFRALRLKSTGGDAPGTIIGCVFKQVSV